VNNSTTTYLLTRNDEVLFKGTWDECRDEIEKRQPRSADWAIEQGVYSLLTYDGQMRPRVLFQKLTSKLFTKEQLKNKECTHREFYGQFCTWLTRARIIRHIGLDTIIKSEGEHFNDISPEKWVSCNLGTDDIRARIHETGGRVMKSTLINIAKEHARQIKEEEYRKSEAKPIEKSFHKIPFKQVKKLKSKMEIHARNLKDGSLKLINRKINIKKLNRSKNYDFGVVIPSCKTFKDNLGFRCDSLLIRRAS